MAFKLRSICAAIAVTIVAVVVGLWRSFVLNELHLFPVDLKGKTVVVTGATEGIGRENAKVLASWGANLILPVRSAEKGEQLRKEILQETGNKVKVDVYPNVDFSEFKTVRDFAKKIESQPIDILVNNAGLVLPSVEESVDGVEKMFQVNHLSPFLLTYLLLPALKKVPSARVVFVSSAAHYTGSIGREKYSLERKGMQEYRPLMRYDDSKLMNVMCAKSFAERFGQDTKITFNSVHPGFVVSNLDNNLPGMLRNLIVKVRQTIGRQPREGAIAQITVATHPKLEGVTGKYFSDSCINSLCHAPCFHCDAENPPGMIPNSEALDKEARDWLWNMSLKLTKLG